MKHEEMLSFYDDELNKIGIAPRSEIHSKGLLHEVVHCWVIDDSCDEKWIYLQQRSFNKKDFPGLYDISAAGHIDIDENVIDAVKREVIEEIGIAIDLKKLKFVGKIREQLCLENFHNNELCHVYLYPLKEAQFELGYEVEKMVKISLSEFKKFLNNERDNIVSFSMDNKNKYILKYEDFCIHDKKYLKLIINFIGK